MKRRTLGNLMAGTLLASVLVVPSIPAQASEDSEEYIEYEADDECEVAEEDSECAVTEEDDMERVFEGELIPPTNAHWDAPGKVAFRPETTASITYYTEVYKNDNLVDTQGSSLVNKNIDYDGYYRSDYEAFSFEGDGWYTLKVYVGNSSNKVYASSAHRIYWVQPEFRVATPIYPHWEVRDGKYYAVCDTVQQGSKYLFSVYEDDKLIVSTISPKNEYDASIKIDDITAHDYTFTVRVSSKDLTRYANSEESIRSLVLGEQIAEGNTFPEEAAIAGVALPDGKHHLKLEINLDGTYAAAKITDVDGNVDVGIDSYIANIVRKYDADGNPEEFYSLVFTDGQWDLSYDSKTMGAYPYEGESYMVASGVVNQTANGLLYTGDAAGWKFLAAGKVVRNNAGLVMYRDEWFWIDDEGSCDENYRAIVNWKHSDFLVYDGRLRTDFTGFVCDPIFRDKWYHIENGQVWGDGVITDISFEGGTMTRTVVKGVVQ